MPEVYVPSDKMLRWIEMQREDAERAMSGFESLFPNLTVHMRQKDAAFLASLGSSNAASLLDKWREKYPEDFPGVVGSTSLRYVEDHASEMIRIPNPTA